MDIDDDNQTQPSSSQAQPQPQPSRRIIAVVDEAHPFDLESYIANYSGSYPSRHSILSY